MDTRIEKVTLSLKDIDLNEGQIDGLPANPRNWTKEELKSLALSLTETPERFEMRCPIVVPHDGRYVVLGGNLRIAAARENKEKEVTCFVFHSTSIEKMKEIVIKDNGAWGKWDYDALANEWSDLPLSDWGIPVWEESPQETAAAAGEEKQATEDDFDEDKDAIAVRCKRGDVWVLGDHRLMCGDSISLDDVKKLMGGGRVNISLMSPPYNVGFTPSEIGTKKTSKYQNDEDKRSSDDYLHLLTESTRNAMSFSDYSFVNVQSVSSNKITLIDYLHDMKESFADVMIWDKESSQPAMAKNVLNSDFEFVYVFSKSATRRIGCKQFRGDVSNILHLSNRKGRDREIQKIHSATFPIDFAAFFLKTFSTDSVLDLFGGSGTTLIAAEQLGRKCYMMELDPHYCDVIISRWEKLTGKTAILEQ